MDRQPPIDESAVHFHRVASLSQLQEGRPRIVRVGVKRIALIRIGRTVHAFNNACPHAGGSLALGKLDRKVIVCPRHEWGFDIETGDCVGHDIYRLSIYAVEVRGDEIRVGIPEERW